MPPTRAARGRLAAVATVVVAAWWALLASPAAAATAPQLSITASGSTSVGLQVFANVNLSGGNHPTGNVTFRLFAPHDTSCTSAIFTSTVAVTGTSINSGHWTTTAAGTYRWEVSYSGDGANSASGPTACSQPSAAVIVSPASTSLNVTAVAPTSGGVLRATAALGGTFHPTGTVTFLLSPAGDMFCSSTAFTSTVPVNGAGNYSSVGFSAPAAGTYKWRASYSGDASNAASPVTACLSPGASVTVSSVGSAPAPPTTSAPAAPPRTTPTTAPSAAPSTIAAPAPTQPVSGPTATTTAAPAPSSAPPGASPLGSAVTPSPSTAAPAGAASNVGRGSALALTGATRNHAGGPPWTLLAVAFGAVAAAIATLMLGRSALTARRRTR